MIVRKNTTANRITNRIAVWIFGALFLATYGDVANAKELQKLRFANATKTITALSADTLVAEYLGYYKQEGLTVNLITLGSTGAILAALNNGSIEFAQMSTQAQLPVAARGERLPAINFFEATYPFRFGLGVLPGSPIKSYADLKGKTVGVPNFGSNEYQTARMIVKQSGLDPDKDVTWLVVGDGGATNAHALERKDIAAVYTSDIGFGAIEATGVKIIAIPLPEKIPVVGGIYLATTPNILSKHRDWAVGLARGLTKAHIFIRENPKAAAYIFGLMAPSAVPVGKSVEEQVKTTMIPLSSRMGFFFPYDKSDPIGFMKERDWHNEVSFVGLDSKIKDVSQFYTNDLVKEVNTFDVEAIKTQARTFKLPYEK